MTLPRLIHLDYYFKIVHKVRENVYEMRTHKGECVFEMDADTMSAIVYKHIPGLKMAQHTLQLLIWIHYFLNVKWQLHQEDGTLIGLCNLYIYLNNKYVERLSSKILLYQIY